MRDSFARAGSWLPGPWRMSSLRHSYRPVSTSPSRFVSATGVGGVGPNNGRRTPSLPVRLADHPPSVLGRSVTLPGGAKLRVGERSIVILLVLVAVLWVVVLAPSVLRRI